MWSDLQASNNMHCYYVVLKQQSQEKYTGVNVLKHNVQEYNVQFYCDCIFTYTVNKTTVCPKTPV